ncbi:hypothetical protein BPS26883_05594 [Burkholderia pseudomultivorans]|uniref:Uncharacterized protein n=1 Tax=Burkholderia pseudomultivorans TaxID=1207504 RepID=A0A6P2Q2P4_9BURK|nr:hypothetical protein BPS26883_05594 [Burkholderia pseudomultivorans]
MTHAAAVRVPTRRPRTTTGAVPAGAAPDFRQRNRTSVDFSSVYFSSACSDLSRPLPDCL